jgi:hypothetical protein
MGKNTLVFLLRCFCCLSARNLKQKLGESVKLLTTHDLTLYEGLYSFKRWALFTLRCGDGFFVWAKKAN